MRQFSQHVKVAINGRFHVDNGSDRALLPLIRCKFVNSITGLLSYARHVHVFTNPVARGVRSRVRVTIF